MHAIRTDVAHNVRQDIIRLCHQGLDWVTLARRATERIGRVVPHESSCWHTIDPATLLLTGSFVQQLADGGFPLFTQCEYAREDVNKWSFLAQCHWPVGILTRVTHGDRDQSVRFRELLYPQGIEWELRASLVSDSLCWGALGFYRHRGEPDFNDREAAFVASIAVVLADGFRRALLVSAVETDDAPDGPGLILLDDRNGVDSISPAAERWLDELVNAGDVMVDRLPHPIYAVADRTRTAADRQDRPALQARARVHTRSGRWLVLHGTRLNGAAEGKIGVIIEPAHPLEIAPLMTEAYGLSDRERKVTQLVLQGLSTNGIAEELYISPHTVQDHLKTIFEKVGVSSRRELVARIFSVHYRPHVLEGAVPGPDGAFAVRQDSPRVTRRNHQIAIAGS
jgi:DNA-binding CsgD family transcriptional regulator